MALVLRNLFEYYQKYHDAQDPRTVELILMNPPWMPFVIVGAYLYFVQSLGPKLMANRKPFDLRNTLLVYNLLQVAANLYLAYFGTKLMIEAKVSLTCQSVDRSTSPRGMREVQLVHYYYLLKVADLFDTIFFVLRKKQSHVSFLHVYHHAMMILLPFFYSRIYPGGHGSVLGLVNTYVHAAMYFYFFLSVWRPEWTRDLRWKKLVTIIQMTQFVAMTIYFGQPAIRGYECGIPRYWFWGVMMQNVFMLVMFADFYVKAYGRRKTK